MVKSGSPDHLTLEDETGGDDMTTLKFTHAAAEPAGRAATPSAGVGGGGGVDAAFAIKWIASLAQMGGYAATAFEATPWNIYLFLIGLTGWLTVGVIWKDRAIMLIHLVALGVMAAGMLR